MNKEKIWIARDEDKVLHAFYDTPEFDEHSYKWYHAREAFTIPTYMFPSIKTGQCYEITLDNCELYKDQHLNYENNENLIEQS